jgi:hypothetical protein
MVMMKVKGNLSKMYDDDEFDDLEPGPAPHMFNNSDESHMFCGEFGRDERIMVQMWPLVRLGTC